MIKALFIAVLLLCACAAPAQSCPEDNPNGPPKPSSPRILTGKVVFHDEIRQWLGLQLDAPACGLSEIQLLQNGGAFEVDKGDVRPFEVYRGCRVTVTGELGIPGTGYYSAELFQNVTHIEPEQGCITQPAFPDYSKSKPNSRIRNYRVLMKLDYKARGGHIFITVRTKNRLLHPWQVYASFWLTGGYAFYANCAEGYGMAHMSGTPEAKPWMIDNQVAMDPESAAEKKINPIVLSFTCRK